MLHFAYGSNLLVPRIRLPERSPNARPVTIAWLDDWRLSFEKRSTDGSGKATVRRAPTGHRVHGMLYELPHSEGLCLDRAEGPGYTRHTVQVTTATGLLSVWLYLAKEHAIDPSAVPFTWYRDLVVAGARQHGFPKTYIQRLLDIKAKDDTDPQRAHRMFGLLQRLNATEA